MNHNKWSPCLRHEWVAIDNSIMIYECSRCKTKGHYPAARGPYFKPDRIAPRKIVPYTCPKCGSDTINKQEICPRCISLMSEETDNGKRKRKSVGSL